MEYKSEILERVNKSLALLNITEDYSENISLLYDVELEKLLNYLNRDTLPQGLIL